MVDSKQWRNSNDDNNHSASMISECIHISRSLSRLLGDLSDDDAQRALDEAFGRWYVSDGHAGLMPPQRDLIVAVLADVVQITDELKVAEYRREYAADYRDIIRAAHSAFNGKTSKLIRCRYGSDAADLWNWAAGRPHWCDLLSSSAEVWESDKDLPLETIEMIRSAAHSVSPDTIAGHLLRVILAEIAGGACDSEPAASVPVQSVEAMHLHGLPDDGRHPDRLRHMIGQLLGEHTLSVERLCCGWRIISTTYW